MCDSGAGCPLALDVPLPFTRRNFLLFAQRWPQEPAGGPLYTIDVLSFSLPLANTSYGERAPTAKPLQMLSDALKMLHPPRVTSVHYCTALTVCARRRKNKLFLLFLQELQAAVALNDSPLATLITFKRWQVKIIPN